MSPPGIRNVIRALGTAHREATFHTYPGTQHWFVERGPARTFHPAAAKLSWKRTLAFLAAK